MRRLSLISLGLILSLLLCSFGVIEAALPFDIPSVESAILVVAETGQVLYEKQSQVSLPSASLAKMMTMLLVLEAIDRGEISWTDTTYTSAKAAAASGSQIWLAEGDRLTVEQLFRAIAIQSANDASIALAEYIAGSEAKFVERMNLKAKQMGLNETHFSNAHGLPVPEGEAQCMVSARDAAAIAMELINNHPEILEITKLWNSELGPGTRNPIVLENTNRLVLDKNLDIDGLKTGHTSEAGYLLVATTQRDGLRLISVIMGADSLNDRDQSTTRLLNYGFSAFERLTIVKQDQTFSVMIPDAAGETDLVPEKEFWAMIPKDKSAQLLTQVVLRPEVSAPMKAGSEAADLIVAIDENQIMRVPLYCSTDVPRANFFVRTWRSFTNWISSLFKAD
jgi:D-alanyl-D-alanine carboxypeptidase (penicillin-binding protein 5/6)